MWHKTNDKLILEHPLFSLPICPRVLVWRSVVSLEIMIDVVLDLPVLLALIPVKLVTLNSHYPSITLSSACTCIWCVALNMNGACRCVISCIIVHVHCRHLLPRYEKGKNDKAICKLW